MTTISHTSQISRQATSGSSTYESEGKNGWDRKLNSLLEDLHGTVMPSSLGGGKDGRASEYREYRMTSSTRNNDEPPSVTEEKWIEYGTEAHPRPGYITSMESSRPGGLTTSSTSSRSLMDSRSKTGYSSVRDESQFGHTHSHTHSNMEFMEPANMALSLRSGQTSPLPPIGSSTTVSRSSPKVDKKEFYSKASYTTLIKGGVPPPGTYVLQDEYPEREHFPINRSTDEYSRETSSSRYAIQEPVYTTPPKVTKPPVESGLKTPPLVRKILQQSEYGGHKQTTQASYIQEKNYQRTPTFDEADERNKKVKYYTSTTTRTETKEGRDNIIRRFPSESNMMEMRGPPQRLDELLATFDESYVETSKIVGDGGGPHKSHPYGPGTRPVEQPQRVVRIDESRNVESEVSRRNVAATNNVSGPPVYYPAREDQVYKSTVGASEEAEMKGKGKAKSKMERQYKEKEKSKSSHKEKGGGGALPVPVCLPVCCAAPCTIM